MYYFEIVFPVWKRDFSCVKTINPKLLWERYFHYFLYIFLAFIVNDLLTFLFSRRRNVHKNNSLRFNYYSVAVTWQNSSTSQTPSDTPATPASPVIVQWLNCSDLTFSSVPSSTNLSVNCKDLHISSICSAASVIDLNVRSLPCALSG